MVRLVLALALVGACYPAPNDAACALTCVTDPVCPGSLTCKEGFCVEADTPMGACGLLLPGDGPPAVDAPDPLLLCPSIYTETGPPGVGGRYRVVLETVTWMESETKCQNDLLNPTTTFTHLVVINTPDEMQFLNELVNAEAWVGYIDGDNNEVWEHVTQEPADVFPGSTKGTPGLGPWGNDEPNVPTENCAILREFDGRLDNRMCNEAHIRVCECDAHAPIFLTPP